MKMYFYSGPWRDQPALSSTWIFPIASHESVHPLIPVCKTNIKVIWLVVGMS